MEPQRLESRDPIKGFSAATMVKNISGKRIKQARKQLGLKQIEVVAIFDVDYGVNISRSTLARIESQSRAARDYELYILSQIFKVPLSWFFEGQELYRFADPS